MRTNQVGEAFDQIRKVVRVFGITDALPILDTNEEGVYEIRFVIRHRTPAEIVTILESIDEELLERSLADVIDRRVETKVGHGTSWGPIDRSSRGMPDLHFLKFRLLGGSK